MAAQTAAQENVQSTVLSALKALQAGTITPRQASDQLLAGQTGRLGQQEESLASLINRLGRPPHQVVKVWLEQIATIAERMECDHVDLPALARAADVSLSPTGGLVWCGRVVELADLPAGKQQRRSRRPEVATLLQAFEQELCKSPGLAAAVPSTVMDQRRIDLTGMPQSVGVPRSAGPIPSARSTSARSTSARATSARTTSARTACAGIACAGIALAALLVLAFVCWSRDGGRTVSRRGAADSSLAASSLAASSLADNSLAAERSRRPSQPVVVEGDQPSAVPIPSRPILTQPTTTQPTTSQPTTSQPTESGSNVALVTLELPLGIADGVELNAGDLTDGLLPDFIQVEPPIGLATPLVSPSNINAVDLLPIDNTNQQLQLSREQLTELAIEFPCEVPLQLRQSDQGWEVAATDTPNRIATILLESGGTFISWNEQAEGCPWSANLAHGRLRVADNQYVYLRRAVCSEPWPLRFDQSDTESTWDLGHAIPPHVSRCRLHLELPQEISMEWVDPYDESAPRRTKGVAVLSSPDHSQIQVALRIDLECRRRLTCRLRFAVRPVVSVPWQPLSGPLIERARQINQQATEMARREADRLSRVYELADSIGRQIIRRKQQNNRSHAERLQRQAESLLELESLVSRLEQQAAVHLHVWVQWPDVNQDLFTMSKP